MRSVIRIVIVACMISAILATGVAFAFMPAERGVNYPHTVWGDQGIKGSVSGKVVTSLDQSKGISGAYVAVVSPLNQVQEYANTTSDANGNFRISGLNATFSSALTKGADGNAGSYQQGMNVYMVYVNISQVGEGYSVSFGIDTNHTNAAIDPVVIYAGQPEAAVVSLPAATAQPTAAAVTPSPSTPTPMPPEATPGPAGQGPIGLPMIAAVVLAVLAIAAIAVYFVFLRKK